MKNYTYIIIGGGMTGYAAIKGIREIDPAGSIALFSEESHPPYKRPPLSKSLWTGKKTLDDVWYEMRIANMDTYLKTHIVRLDPQAHTVEDQDGQVYQYEQLLLATGGSPRNLPFSAAGIIYYRTVDDYQALREAAQPGRSFAVIGGGFIGAEIAAALQMAGSSVKIIFPEESINNRIFPAGLAQNVTDYYRQKGVDVLAGEAISAIQKEGDQYLLSMKSGREIRVDGVVAGIGLQLNTSLAEAAGLKVENGIHVDPNLQTEQPGIFAAGDVANFYAQALGRRLRVEHEDNALSMGRLAGQNMAKSQASRPQDSYDHVPYFYSDLFDLGYEAVGTIDSRMEVVENWQEPYRKGVLYYLDGGVVRGVLMWNVWDQIPMARNLLGQPLEQAVGQVG